MNVTLGRIAFAATLVLGLTGAGVAREAGTPGATARNAAPLHGIGFAEPKFRSALRTGRDQPYTWPVSDRYRPVSQPYFGRAY